MTSAVTVRALFQDHPDANCKALRDIVRALGVADEDEDSFAGAQRADDGPQAAARAEQRAAFDAADCGARLLQLSRHVDDTVRELATDALGVWGGDAARDRLHELVSDAVLAVRASAVGALAGWADERPSVEVMLIALEDSKWIVRLRAAHGLSRAPGDDVDRALVHALLDPDSFVRTTAADALVQRPTERILPRIRKLMEHPAPHLFDAAFDVLGRIGTDEDAAFLARVGRLTNFSQPSQVKGWARAAAQAIRKRNASRGR